jgi:hypothetical protein
MDLFAASPDFAFNTGNTQSDITGVSNLGAQAAANWTLSPFPNMGESHAEIGMEMDDPVLSSLQTLAEGQEFGDDFGQPQNFNVWDWFEMQQQQ